MRTRDRPWSSMVTRRVLPGEEVTYHWNPVLSQTHQLASHGVRPYQLLAPGHFTSCVHNKAPGDERGVYFTDCQRNLRCGVSIEKSVLQTSSSQPVHTNLSFAASGKNKSEPNRDTINENVSLSLVDRPTGHISKLISHPVYPRTRSFLSQRSLSTSQLRLKVWPLNRNNSRSFENILNIDRIENNRVFHTNSNITGPDRQNSPEATVDKIKRIGMKNRYRIINETVFHLSPDSESSNANDGETVGKIQNGRKSPALCQMSLTPASRTSTPEFPPIANESFRGDKWKIAPGSVSSTTGLKIPTDRRSIVMSNFSRRNSNTTAESNTLSSVLFGNGRFNKDRSPSRRNSTTTADSNTLSSIIFANGRFNMDRLPRNNSDSSIYNLNGEASNPSKGSDCTTESSATPLPKETGDGNSSRQSRDVVKCGGVKYAKYLGGSNRQPTLPTTDTQGRLEFLFERQNGRKSCTVGITNKTDIINNNADVSNKTTRIQHTNSSIANKGNRVTNVLKVIHNMPQISTPPRSTLGKDVAINEGSSRHRTANRKSKVDGNYAGTKTDGVSVNKGRITRSQSEHKLSEKSSSNKQQEKTTPHSTSRNRSVERIDKLRPQSLKYRRAVTSTRNQQAGKFQTKQNHGSNTNRYPRQVLNNASNKDDMYYFEDNIDANDRLFEWLNVVNNVDRYDTDPKDDFIDYSDEPPQTDTAIHLVYQGE